MLKVLILCSYYYVQSVLVNQSYFGQGHFGPPKHHIQQTSTELTKAINMYVALHHMYNKRVEEN